MKYSAVIFTILGFDQGVKNYIEKNIDEGEVLEKPGRLLIIKKHHNKGAFLNFGQQKRRIVTALSVLMTIMLTVIFILTLGNAGKGTLKWGLTLLLGGAYSNTYDRLFRKYVVDYVSFNVPCGLRKVIFNIGDFAIMAGSLFVLIASFGEEIQGF